MAVLGGTNRPGLSRGWAAVGLVGAVVAFGVGAVLYRWLAPGVDMVSVELAGDAAKGAAAVGTRGGELTRALNADWLLIAGYLTALVTACTLGGRVFWTGRARRVAGLARIATVGAAVSDALENGALYPSVTGRGRDWTWALAQSAAVTKFALLVFAVPVAVVAWGVTATRLARRGEQGVPEGVVLPPSVEPVVGDLPATAPLVGRRPPTGRWSDHDPPPGRAPGRVGICVSGGGVRSACLALGALQELRSAGELGRADYLVSVSGGGYLTGALQLALQPRYGAGDQPVRDPNAATPADVLDPGSEEEDHLRRHSRYIADGTREWAAALGVLLRGLLCSLALLALTVVAVGLPLGAFYHRVPIIDLDRLRAGFDLASPPGSPAPVAGVGWAVVAFGGLAELTYLVAIGTASLLGRRSTPRDRLARTSRRLVRTACGLAAAGGPVVLLGAALPGLVWLAAEVVRWFGRTGGPTTPAGGAVSTVLLAYLGTLAGVLWRRRVAAGAAAGRLRGRQPTRAVPRGITQRLIVGLALLTIAAALLLLLCWTVASARRWPRWVPFLTYAVLGFVVLLVDQTWLSLHPFYRRRLASAFAVRRATDAVGQVVAAPYDFDTERTTLSSYAARPAHGGFPKVIFAAAANLNGPGRTPPGRRAVSFTFADDWVGGPDVGWVTTRSLEGAVSGHLQRDLTVQAAVAISGAAFASAMGRGSRPYQAFLALSNARLGAWLPNPGFLGELANGADWTTPRLPRLRRLGYLLREIVGSHPPDDRLLYCTDAATTRTSDWSSCFGTGAG